VIKGCAGFILVGGASSRFGRDKALVSFRGTTLLAMLCDVLRRSEVSQIAVVGSPEKYATACDGAPCIPDGWPGEGPLGGILTALQATAKSTAGDGSRSASPDACEWCLIVGCDMPFLSREWLTYMVRRAAASSADVVVPESRHGFEPLCACWHTSALDVLEREFETGTRRITEAMKHLRMEILDETHWKRFDSAGRLFWNMNTPADYEEVKRILETDCA
jgi:molybdenum cofactor guanylyltransferase